MSREKIAENDKNKSKNSQLSMCEEKNEYKIGKNES
jgi:hypothetical protein